MDHKRMDELGFLIWTSGRIDFYGKRNCQEQKVLDQSISHMQSFEKQIAPSLLFKMLKLELKNYDQILTLSEEIALKNIITFVNCNTFDINGKMLGFLFLPSIFSAEQEKTLLQVVPLFSDFEQLTIHKNRSHRTKSFYTFAHQELQDQNQLARTLITILHGEEKAHHHSL